MSAAALPLERMKVLDLSRAFSVPFCSAILDDLGPDVIKVEPAPGGDMIRTRRPFDRHERVYYLSGNRNKRSPARWPPSDWIPTSCASSGRN